MIDPHSEQSDFSDFPRGTITTFLLVFHNILQPWLQTNQSRNKNRELIARFVDIYLNKNYLQFHKWKIKWNHTGWNGPETANAIINDSFRGCDNFYQTNHSCLSFDKRALSVRTAFWHRTRYTRQNVIIIQKFRIYNCLKIKRSTATAFCLVQRYLTILVVLNVAVLTCRESALFRSPLATILKQLTQVKVSVF